MALPKYVDEYVPFNKQQKEDFYDLMTPTWSEQMAKQYNKDMEKEAYQKSFIDKYSFPNTSLNGISNKDINDAVNPAHYKGIVGNYQYIECMEFILGFEGLSSPHWSGI